MQKRNQIEEELKQMLIRNNQGHLVKVLEECASDKLEGLVDQVKGIDYEQIKGLSELTKKVDGVSEQKMHDQINPLMKYQQLKNIDKQEYMQIGEQMIKDNKVGVIMMAAGQGSRLGYEHAKGMYNIGLISQKSIFQIIMERLKGLQNRVNSTFNINSQIQLFIMTSPMNHSETQQFLENNKYFGLDGNQVHLFKQGILPAINTEGQIIMESKDKLFMAPNGNGGVYQAVLENEEIMKQMDKLEYVQIIGIDNVLVKIADPVFIGYMKKNNYRAGAKYVSKREWNEKVGVHCVQNGKVKVVEYSELTEQQMKQEDDEGLLKYRTGNIVNIMLKVEFIQSLNQHKQEILQMYHVATKQMKNYDLDIGQTKNVKGYKFELFVFDVYGFINPDEFGCLEALRESEFAPVKNKEGVDSPQTARDMISQLHKSWMQQAGHQLNGDGICEISGLVTYEGENLDQLFKENNSIELPVHIE